MPDKLNIGWFSFACCEDSTIMFAELLNDYFFEFKDHFNFVDAPVISSKRDEEASLDIAFVEGAANDPKHPEQLQKIRHRSKVVVAIGSCACTGMPSAYRNNFDEAQNKEIEFLIENFKYPNKIQKIADIIPIDAQVPGCPMDLDAFMSAVNGLLEQFGHEIIQLKNV
jgi:sulfhydrogenase subunit delta